MGLAKVLTNQTTLIVLDQSAPPQKEFRIRQKNTFLRLRERKDNSFGAVFVRLNLTKAKKIPPP